MTVVPVGVRVALLICDQCGAEETAAETSYDGDLVWSLVSGRGWSGSAFPTGPHHCPRCGAGTPATPEPVARERTHGASYHLRAHGDTAVVTPLTDLDGDLAESLRDDLMAAVATHPHVVVDL